MDIFGILDPDPHENLCGSETLVTSICDNDPDLKIFFVGKSGLCSLIALKCNSYQWHTRTSTVLYKHEDARENIRGKFTVLWFI